MPEPFRPPAHPAVLGDIAYAAALALFLYLQKVGLRLRREEEATWWASNGRDVVNALAAITLSAAVWLQGVAPWLSVFFGGTLTLALSVLHTFVERHHPEPWKPLVVAAAVLGAPLLLAPESVAEGAAAILRASFFGR